MEAWRVVKKRYAAISFSGEGASRTGGRWNSRGVRVVYTSGTKSLAVLENLVHLNPPIVFEYAAIRLEFAEGLVEKIDFDALPADWREEPPPPASKLVGDLWVKERRSAILRLPSVIVPGEANFLLNPAHPGFSEIVLGTPERFAFDSRLLA